MSTIYGDTSASLFGFQVGGDQFIQGENSLNSYTAVFNYLYGDAYAMRGASHGGNDTILGGSAGVLNERIYGDAYVMQDFSQGGNDYIIGGIGDSHSNPLAFGDAYEMHGFAKGGNDQIIGVSGTVYGDAFSMDGFTVGGDDMIIAGILRKSIFGDAATLSGFARGGNDHIQVNDGWAEINVYGDGTLSGFARGGNDHIIGGANSPYQVIMGDGPMSGFAHGGNDVIVAGDGSYNLLWGDGPKTGNFTVGGDDTFVFSTGARQNQILDFEQGKDHIDLTAFASEGIHGICDLTIRSGDQVVLGNGTVIQGSSIDLGDQYQYIAVLDVDHLKASDFIFA